MRRYVYGFLVVILVFGLTAGVYGDDSVNLGGGPRVYIAGSYYDGEKEIACYWINSSRTDLPGDGIHNSTAKSIYISNGAVYTAGSYRNETIACYWQDKNRTDLFIDIYDTTKAESVFLAGDQVYVAGNHHDKDHLPCYWTGTTKTDLDVYKYEPGVYRSATSADASSIYVSGDRVYVAGNLNEHACYWVNGSRIDLPASKTANQRFAGRSDAHSIFIADKKVYVAGFYEAPFSTIPCYWVDNQRIDLPDNGWANSIYISDGIVYVAGSYRKMGKLLACCWKDKIRKDLPVPNGAGMGAASSIYVSNGNVYVAGAYGNEENTTACYWVNQKRIDLPGYKGRANSVFVR